MSEKKTRPSDAEIEQFGSVGQIMDPDWTAQPAEQIAEPVLPPVLEGQPDFPEVGIYFGMDEETYHAIPALSSSGIKKLAASSMDFWANSWLNPDKEERQSRFLDYGKAAHVFVLEGEEEYLSRYAVDLDPADFEGKPMLISTAEIKAAIGRFTELRPVSPEGTTKQVLIDQLDALGQRHGKPVDLEGTVPQLKDRIRQFEEEQPVSPVSRVSTYDDDGNEISVAASKGDWIAQLLSLDPDALIWDDLMNQHHTRHAGKTMIRVIDDHRIRLAARMIQAHPEIGKRFQSGHPEVSVFWFCPVTGAPMKSRFDWVDVDGTTDLKTFSNKSGDPVDHAIERTIASYRYNIQHCVYDEAAEAAKAMVRESGQLVVFSKDDCGVDQHMERVDFCERWCGFEEPNDFVFVFQQSGQAPVTRGKRMPREAMGVFGTTQRRIEELKRFWVMNVEVYGLDPWVDTQPITMIEDEEIPMWATRI